MFRFNIDLLKKLMKQNNLRASQIARLTGVTRQAVSRYLKGTRRKPDTTFLISLTKLFPEYRMIEDFLLPIALPESDTSLKESA
jgi:transcriptional regulator with XRE-family HTH domain